jgi:hypothetical protein
MSATFLSFARTHLDSALPLLRARILSIPSPAHTLSHTDNLAPIKRENGFLRKTAYAPESRVRGTGEGAGMCAAGRNGEPLFGRQRHICRSRREFENCISLAYEKLIL